MAFRLQSVALLIIGLVIAAAIVVGAGSVAIRTQVTIAAKSPDGTCRAELLDRPNLPSIDRNFRLRIVDAQGTGRTLFTSPDEPPSGIGRERFLWSKDNKRLLLVGRKFWVREGVELENGEFLYLLCDPQSGQCWCNSDQRGPPFGLDELAGFDFGEPLVLKPELAK